MRSWRPTDAVLRRTFLGALVANTVIVVTGGAVRLTASGLGCPTFPRCTDESLVATREMGAHGAIEFGNRLLTFVLSAAVLAIPLIPTLGEQGSAALVGIAFLLWVPVLPRWLAHEPEIRLRFSEGARADEWPRAVAWGGVEEPVEVVRSALDERDGVRMRRFRLRLADGTVLDVSRDEPDGDWRIDREVV